MQFLATTFGSMFSQLFAQFLLLFGRKYTVAIASTLAFIAATLTMIFFLKTLIVTIIATASAPVWFIQFLAWIIPTNWIALFSTIMSGRICRAAYDSALYKIALVNQAS